MQTLRRVSYYGFLALLIYMPFHIFLSQSLSLATGGLEVWKIAKDVVLFGLTLFTICLVFWNRAGGKTFYWLLGLSVLYGLSHAVLWAANPDIFTESAAIGFVYNNRLPCLLPLGFGAKTLNKDMFVFSSVIKIVIGVTSVIALLAIVQYLLPKDILTHFGYSLDRGVRPAFFIDDNPALPRVMSTLREPNALGAFLIVPIALLVALWSKVRGKQRWLLAGLLGLHGAALLLTHSRSAWIGAFVAVVLVLLLTYRKEAKTFVRKFWPVIVGTLVIVTIGLFAARNTDFVREYIVHAPAEEQVTDLDSNDYHFKLVAEGVEGVLDQPLGHGPGTAGLASIQNPEGAKLTENYYVQIAYEVGIIGLAIFVALSAMVYLRLWRRKDYIGIALVASFWGYVVTNMLLHTWSNEAVATQWWLLAGAAVASAASITSKKP